MKRYDSYALREAALQSGIDSVRFGLALDFVEWTGIAAPVMALERARGLRQQVEDAVLGRGAANWTRDYQECRLSLETAARYQHSSGDAVVRLLFAALTDDTAPAEMHMSSFERHFPSLLLGLPVFASARTLRSSPEWSYICAFDNTLKHMSLMEHEFNVGLLGAESRGLEFRSFEYKGWTFDACSQAEFERILHGASDLLTDVLGSLETHLVSKGSG